MTRLHVLGGDSMGGCERLSIDLGAYYAETQPEMTQAALFFGQAGSGPAWREFQTLGIAPYAIPFEGRVIPFVRAVRRFCRQQRVRTVLTHGFGMHLLIALAARLGGEKGFGARRKPSSHRSGNAATNDLWRECARPLVTCEIACSDYVKQQMVRQYHLPSRRVNVVHNWVRVDEIAERSASARAQRDSVGDHGARGAVIIMVARLDPIKDHATVIRALAILRTRFPATKLRLVGDGPIRGQLESLVAELDLSAAVEFLGSREDIAEQLGALTSLSTGQRPMKVLELCWPRRWQRVCQLSAPTLVPAAKCSTTARRVCWFHRRIPTQLPKRLRNY